MDVMLVNMGALVRVLCVALNKDSVHKYCYQTVLSPLQGLRGQICRPPPQTAMLPWPTLAFLLTPAIVTAPSHQQPV